MKFLVILSLAALGTSKPNPGIVTEECDSKFNTQVHSKLFPRFRPKQTDMGPSNPSIVVHSPDNVSRIELGCQACTSEMMILEMTNLLWVQSLTHMCSKSHITDKKGKCRCQLNYFVSPPAKPTNKKNPLNLRLNIPTHK
ncbi:hypothetical protein DSO57_1027180 [Entomophthora muscae]|uniref:Uncharacterized protein n=1 Tax=Entomophthora muscae TaxID=34485 RepID=A0ACC2T1Q8_9FUNG|nr:hypothetical protein DSO57_1027180 [Entomophthora muscae]